MREKIKSYREEEEREREEKAKGWNGLVSSLPPQSGAASDSICFKYMDRETPGRLWVEKRMGTGITIPISRDST